MAENKNVKITKLAAVMSREGRYVHVSSSQKGVHVQVNYQPHLGEAVECGFHKWCVTVADIVVLVRISTIPEQVSGE